MATTGAPIHFATIALIGRQASPAIAEPLAALAAFLAARGHRIIVEAETAQYAHLPGHLVVDPGELAETADLAIVLGGDGTMLSIARQMAPHDVPLIGINQGRLGFLTDIPLAQMEATLAAMLAGRFTEERRTLLAAAVVRGNGGHDEALALNDVVVNRGAVGSMIECAVEIDGRFVYAMRADGIIVATPTGSTAYALSAGGPILAPELASILLVPVAPHALTHRPIVISDNSTVAITVIGGRDAGVHCDGQAHYTLGDGDRVVVKRAGLRARFLHPENHDYFGMLREKLHWSETPERLSNARVEPRSGK